MAGKKSKRKQVYVKTSFSSPKDSPSHSPACNPESNLCASSPKHATCDPHPSVDASAKMCRHLEKDIDVDKLSSKLAKIKFSITHCHDCKESKSGAGKKGKGRSNSKKESAVNAIIEAHLQKKWVCLACGHVACAAQTGKKPKEHEVSVLNEEDRDVPTGHVWNHSRRFRHALALQTTDNLVWCFVCNMAVDCTASSSSFNGNSQESNSNVLQLALKVVQEKLVKENGFLKDPGKKDLVVEVNGFNSVHTVQSNGFESSPLKDVCVTGIRKNRVVKGLINLGNTCFFNSVMQNLLALDMLRDYFSQDLPAVEGPLSSSLRKLYLETSLDGGGQLCMGTSEPSGYESGLKKGSKGRATWENIGACNPRSLFGAICAKAPCFRGFQQQDSHELLRCLLDGLTSEERGAKAKSTCSGDVKESKNTPGASQFLRQHGERVSAEPLTGAKEGHSLEDTVRPSVTPTTFVERFFGGQLCSTVRCCECGHSSVVFEPMLDLSLPIPNPKKGQFSVIQSKLSSSGGGSQQRIAKQTKILPKTSLHRVSHAKGPTVVDINRTSLQGGQSVQADQTSILPPAGTSSPSHPAMDNSTSNDFGWLEFISGGMQSAESSVQGSGDAPNLIEVSESNLILDLVDPKATKADNLEAAQAMNAAAKVSKNVTELGLSIVKEQENKPFIERVEAGTSSNDKEEVGKPLALSEVEDGPLPLASGILLLPYEPLDTLGALSTFPESVPTCTSSPTHPAMDNSTADDFGWLEFINGGMQSAASSVQGSCDAPNLIEVSESNLALDLVDPKATKADNPEVAQAMNAAAKVSKNVADFGLSNVEEQENKPFIERVEAGTSLNIKEEVGKSLALSEVEDGPLPLASGILSLPYEPLDKSGALSTFPESAPMCSLMDIASPSTELEGAYLDGFSQLFEEEESCSAASENLTPSCKYLEASHTNDESICDDRTWEPDTAVYGPAPLRLVDADDAFLPMSLERCLADFTKTELLCGENAWECESCTQRMKEKACSVNSESLISSVSIKDMNCRERDEEVASTYHQRNCRLLSCNGNGIAEKVKPVGGDSRSIKGSTPVPLVVDHIVEEYKNGGSHLTKSIDGHYPVSLSPFCNADDTVADTSKLEEDNESGVQGKGCNTSLHSSPFIPTSEEATRNSCNGMEDLVNKENLTTFQSKVTKGAKSKIRSKQPPEKLVKKDATKRLSISKAPPILTVHLKRFAQDMRGRLSKLSGHVTFPEILDLQPFLDPRCLDLTSCFYQLVGVVEHGGTMRGGHYIAYVRSSNPEEAMDAPQKEGKDAWYCVSDSSVHKASLQAVLNSEAYLLFYEKCNVASKNGST